LGIADVWVFTDECHSCYEINSVKTLKNLEEEKIKNLHLIFIHAQNLSVSVRRGIGIRQAAQS